MKKLFVLFAFMGLVSFAVNAQTCCAKKSASTTSVESNDVIVKAASLDASVEQRVCEKSGSVSFVRKNVCEKSGKVSYVDVQYDAATQKFVNVSPSDNAHATTSSKVKKVAATTKKDCSAAEKAGCSKTASSKSCCSKGKSASATATSKVKLVKAED